jgi:hypothetical protein
MVVSCPAKPRSSVVRLGEMGLVLELGVRAQNKDQGMGQIEPDLRLVATGMTGAHLRFCRFLS